MVRNLPAMQETWVWSLGQEDPLEKGMATHSGILAWRIPWMEEPGGLQSMGLQRVGHDGVTNTVTSGVATVMHKWRGSLWDCYRDETPKIGLKEVLRDLGEWYTQLFAPQMLSSAFLELFSLNLPPPCQDDPKPMWDFSCCKWGQPAVFLPHVSSPCCCVLFGVVVINRTQTWKCELEKMVQTQ